MIDDTKFFGLAFDGTFCTRAEVEASARPEDEKSYLRRLLWAGGDRPSPPTPGAVMVAHDTGDGWSLMWEGEDGSEGGDIEWPFGDDALTARDMERLGFVVV